MVNPALQSTHHVEALVDVHSNMMGVVNIHCLFFFMVSVEQINGVISYHYIAFQVLTHH